MIHPSGIQTTDYEPCEVYEPRQLQVANAARIKDAYPRRVKRSRFWLIQFGYALMVLFILLASFAALFIIAEALR